MGVLGEASSSEVNVPIIELGDAGSGDTVGALDPNFCLCQPISFFIGTDIKCSTELIKNNVRFIIFLCL